MGNRLSDVALRKLFKENNDDDNDINKTKSYFPPLQNTIKTLNQFPLKPHER